MRLFIAIPLSDEMKSAVTGTMHEMKKAGVKGSYVPTRNLHLTLAFIGEMKEVLMRTTSPAFRPSSVSTFFHVWSSVPV